MRRIGDLGEFELIARIERRARRLGGGAVALGIGDDAALLRLRSGEELAVSVDSSVEGVHFRFDQESARVAGARAMGAALSDLAAMGARPLGCVVALAAPAKLPLARFDGLMTGLLATGHAHRAPVCGGNLARAREVSLHVTALGAVRKGRALTRRGTRAGDRVFVTGALGLSALQRVRGRVRHVPTPRIEAGRRLARVAGVVACIDVSDGLEADLAHLLGPRLALPLDPARWPLARGVAAGARRLGLAPADLARRGEDYELLFTLRGRASVEALARRLGLPVTELGRVERVSGDPGSAPREGFRHF